MDEKIKNKLSKYLAHYSDHMADHAAKIAKLADELKSDDLKKDIFNAVTAIKKSVEILKALEEKIK